MRFLAVALALVALIFAALGVVAIWLPFSSDPPDTATGFMIGLGCFVLAVALALAWIARQAWRFYRE
jgi:hypothetical protein